MIRERNLLKLQCGRSVYTNTYTHAHANITSKKKFNCEFSFLYEYLFPANATSCIKQSLVETPLKLKVRFSYLQVNRRFVLLDQLEGEAFPAVDDSMPGQLHFCRRTLRRASRKDKDDIVVQGEVASTPPTVERQTDVEKT